MGWIEHMKYFKCIWQTTASVLRSLHSENTKERIATYCTKEWSTGIQGPSKGGFLDLLYPGLDRIPVGLTSVFARQLWMKQQLMFPVKKSCPLHKEIIHPCLSTAALTLQYLEWHSQGLVAGWACGWWATRHGTSFSPGMGFSSFGTAKPMAQVLFHLLHCEMPFYIL